MISNVELAIYNTVHDFRRGECRGAAGLAELLGRNPGTFANKANPAMLNHHFTGPELIAIMNQAQDYRILHAVAHACHHSCIDLGDFCHLSDMALLDAYAHMHSEIGETAGAIRAAIADGEITRQEFNEIDREFMEDIRAMLELRARLQTLAVDA